MILWVRSIHPLITWVLTRRARHKRRDHEERHGIYIHRCARHGTCVSRRIVIGALHLVERRGDNTAIGSGGLLELLEVIATAFAVGMSQCVDRPVMNELLQVREVDTSL